MRLGLRQRRKPIGGPELPLPPAEMRELVGPTDPALFDNPTGALVYDGLPAE